MTHYRTVLRKAAENLIKAHPDFSEAVQVLSSATVDPGSVPCWSVSTPSEDRDDHSNGLFRADTNLIVASTIYGAAETIEDDLDTHSETIETLLIAGLKAETGVQGVLLRRTELKTGPEDKKITGSVMMLFEVSGFIQDV